MKSTPNRAARRAEARRGRKLAALGSGAALAATGAAATVALIATPAGAATIVVENTNDSGAGSLRDALAAATDGDVIDLTGLSGQITLASSLVIEDLVTITGPGAGVLTISGNDAVRVFNMDETVASAGTVTITGVTIADGNVGGPGAGIFLDCDGVEVSLVLDGVAVTGNTATELGGGLYFDVCDSGDLTITNSTISNNETTSGGGGIWFDDSDSLTIVNTTVSGNTAGESGGGLYFDDGASLVVRNSTFSGNTAAADRGGGAIHTDSGEIPHTTTIANSTFTGNEAGYGGAITIFYGDLALLQTTISGNTATGSFGGYDRPADGLYLSGTDSNGAGVRTAERTDPQTDAPDGEVGAQDVGDVTITGTIIAGNDDTDVATYFENTAEITSDHSLFGAVTDNVTVTDVGGTQEGVDDPGLEPLADNGGPTRTMALSATSPALDTGPDPVPDFPGNEFDQRGPDFLRVAFGRVDIGAYEVQAPVPPGPVPIVLEPTFTG
jgi:predicted outer membrane repeat protein